MKQQNEFMPLPIATHLHRRDVFRLRGAHRQAFLQSIVSNDVGNVTDICGVYAALLTPQGKFLHDMFIIADRDTYLVECERTGVEDLIRRLSAYQLRSDVAFEHLNGAVDVWATWTDSHADGLKEDGSNVGSTCRQALSFPDPRFEALGNRCYIPKGDAPNAVTVVDESAYNERRLAYGITDGCLDLESGKSTLAEGNFDLLHGIDWGKGCYIGQELTARMHYRGLAKKRLFPVRIEGPSPEEGAVLDDGAGDMRSWQGSTGLALLRCDAALEAVATQKPLSYRETKLWPSVPSWMKIDAVVPNR